MNGKLIILCGPSGVGKSTLREMVISNNPDLNICYGLSATTRQPRKNEINNIDYLFINSLEFKRLIDNDLLLEYTEYSNNYYGVLTDDVKTKLMSGKNVILEIELDGFNSILSKELDFVSNIISIFLLPPTMEELKRRLISRNTNSPEDIERRLEKAKYEVMQTHLFTNVVVNDNLLEAYNEILKILK